VRAGEQDEDVFFSAKQKANNLFYQRKTKKFPVSVAIKTRQSHCSRRRSEESASADRKVNVATWKITKSLSESTEFQQNVWHIRLPKLLDAEVATGSLGFPAAGLEEIGVPRLRLHGYF